MPEGRNKVSTLQRRYACSGLRVSDGLGIFSGLRGIATAHALYVHAKNAVIPFPSGDRHKRRLLTCHRCRQAGFQAHRSSRSIHGLGAIPDPERLTTVLASQ
jgi:hypothetical protein